VHPIRLPDNFIFVGWEIHLARIELATFSVLG
jgi:hypothetical protein